MAEPVFRRLILFDGPNITPDRRNANWAIVFELFDNFEIVKTYLTIGRGLKKSYETPDEIPDEMMDFDICVDPEKELKFNLDFSGPSSNFGVEAKIIDFIGNQTVVHLPVALQKVLVNRAGKVLQVFRGQLGSWATLKDGRKWFFPTKEAIGKGVAKKDVDEVLRIFNGFPDGIKQKVKVIKIRNPRGVVKENISPFGPQGVSGFKGFVMGRFNWRTNTLSVFPDTIRKISKQQAKAQREFIQAIGGKRAVEKRLGGPLELPPNMRSIMGHEVAHGLFVPPSKAISLKHSKLQTKFIDNLIKESSVRMGEILPNAPLFQRFKKVIGGRPITQYAGSHAQMLNVPTRELNKLANERAFGIESKGFNRLSDLAKFGYGTESFSEINKFYLTRKGAGKASWNHIRKVYPKTTKTFLEILDVTDAR